MRVEVNPGRVRFTQDSIANHFKEPHEKTSIDDAVTNIVRGVWSDDTFPTIRVIKHEGVMWSLDNRRLWVFREARLNIVTVNMDVKFASHPRFQELVRNPSVMQTFKSDTFKPRVRRKNTKSIPKTRAAGYSRSSTLPVSTKPAITPDSRILKHSVSTSAALEWGRPQIPSRSGSRSGDELILGQNKLYSTQTPNSESSLRVPLIPKSAGSCNYSSSSSTVQQPSPLWPAPPSSRSGRDYSSPPTLSKRNNAVMKEASDDQAPGVFLSLLRCFCCVD